MSLARIVKRMRKQPPYHSTYLLQRLDLMLAQGGAPASPAPKGQHVWRCSALGSCPRALVLEAIGAPQNETARNPQWQRRLDNGTCRHDAAAGFLGYLRRLDGQAGFQLEGTEVLLWDGQTRLEGHADGVAKINGERLLVEFKTLGDALYEQFLTRPILSLYFNQQVQAYMHLADVAKCVVIAERKSDQQWHEKVVLRDPQEWRRIWAFCMSLNAYLRDGSLPPILNVCKAGSPPPD